MMRRRHRHDPAAGSQSREPVPLLKIPHERLSPIGRGRQVPSGSTDFGVLTLVAGLVVSAAITFTLPIKRDGTTLRMPPGRPGASRSPAPPRSRNAAISSGISFLASLP
nr:hypothetical protein [uncultured Rhodopila sp.]